MALPTFALHVAEPSHDDSQGLLLEIGPVGYQLDIDPSGEITGHTYDVATSNEQLAHLESLDQRIPALRLMADEAAAAKATKTKNTPMYLARYRDEILATPDFFIIVPEISEADIYQMSSEELQGKKALYTSRGGKQGAWQRSRRGKDWQRSERQPVHEWLSKATPEAAELIVEAMREWRELGGTVSDSVRSRLTLWLDGLQAARVLLDGTRERVHETELEEHQARVVNAWLTRRS